MSQVIMHSPILKAFDVVDYPSLEGKAEISGTHACDVQIAKTLHASMMFRIVTLKKPAAGMRGTE